MFMRNKKVYEIDINQRTLRRHDNQVQCGTPDWILEQNMEINEKTGEI